MSEESTSTTILRLVLEVAVNHESRHIGTLADQLEQNVAHQINRGLLNINDDVNIEKYTLKTDVVLDEPVALIESHHDQSRSDYVLADEVNGCWITVGNISVYVLREAEGVLVKLYPNGHEDYELAKTFALYESADLEVCAANDLELAEVTLWSSQWLVKDFAALAPFERLELIDLYAKAKDMSVIYSESESETGGFFSHQGKFGKFSSAKSYFTGDETAHVAMPASKLNDAEFITVQTAVLRMLAENSGDPKPKEVIRLLGIQPETERIAGSDFDAWAALEPGEDGGEHDFEWDSAVSDRTKVILINEFVFLSQDSRFTTLKTEFNQSKESFFTKATELFIDNGYYVYFSDSVFEVHSAESLAKAYSAEEIEEMLEESNDVFL